MGGVGSRFAGVSPETKKEIKDAEKTEREAVKEQNDIDQAFIDAFAPHGAKDPHRTEDTAYEGAAVDLANTYDLDKQMQGKDGDGGTYGDIYGADEEGAAHDQLELQASEIENFLRNFAGQNKELPSGRQDVGALVKFTENSLGKGKWDDKQIESVAFKMAKAGDLSAWLNRAKEAQNSPKIQQEIKQAFTDYNQKKIAGGGDKSKSTDLAKDDWKSEGKDTRSRHLEKAGVDTGKLNTYSFDNTNKNNVVKEKVGSYINKQASKDQWKNVSAKAKEYVKEKIYNKAREITRQSIKGYNKEHTQSLRAGFMANSKYDASRKSGERLQKAKAQSTRSANRGAKSKK